jgi:hypothetical protein
MKQMQVQKIIAKVDEVKNNGDGTHHISFVLDKEINIQVGQYIIFTFEKDGKSFEYKHTIRKVYSNTKNIEENVLFKNIEEEFFLPALKKDEVFSITGPFDFTFLEKVKAIVSSSLVMGVRNKVVAVIVLFVILLLVLFIKGFTTQSALQKTQPSSPKVVAFIPKKTVYENILPPNFPQDIPVEKNIKLSNSYAQEDGNIKEESISFSSQKSSQENINVYRNFLKQKQWVLVENKQIKGRYFLSAKKDTTVINISIFDVKKNTTTNATSSELFSKIHSNVAIRIMTTSQ